MSESSKLILVGRVAGGFGVRGEVRISTYTQDPMTLLAFGSLKAGDGREVLRLTSSRPAKGGIIARAREVETKEQADALRGLRLFVAREVLPPTEDEDEFYLADLIGLAVRSPSGEVLGTIKAVQDFGAGDLLEIDPGEGRATWLAPFTRAVVPEVNLVLGFVLVDRPPETE